MIIMAYNFTIGCDPELFVKDPRGRIVSAHGLIPGTKEEPFKVDGGAVQVDGMAVEINIDPVPVYNRDLFSRRVISVASQLKKMLPPRYGLVPIASHKFDDDYIGAQPEEARELGCNPDFGAWQDGSENPAPDASVSYRTAAGHIHIGWGKDIPVDHPDHIAICCKIVKMLDLYVGPYCSLIDEDNLRSSLYGKAGAFRPKSYGVEYRTPSNAWLRTHTNRKDVCRMVDRAIQSAKMGRSVDEIVTSVLGHKDALEIALNTKDLAALRSIYNYTDGWNEPFVSQADPLKWSAAA
jgi:hypothetical protein